MRTKSKKVKTIFQDLESAATAVQRFIPDLNKAEGHASIPSHKSRPGPPAVSSNESIVKSNSAVSVDMKSWLASVLGSNNAQLHLGDWPLMEVITDDVV